MVFAKFLIAVQSKTCVTHTQALTPAPAAPPPQLLIPPPSAVVNNGNGAKKLAGNDELDGQGHVGASTSRGMLSPGTGSGGASSSIQSNKVDSSGLNATPPHNRFVVLAFNLQISVVLYKTGLIRFFTTNNST